MSLRSSVPGYGSNYVVRIAHRGDESSAALEPWAFWTLILIIPVLAIAGIASATAMLFRDEIVLGLMQRQTEMQTAYEERIDYLRSSLDRLAGRQLLDRDTLEGQVQELLSRQAQLESRSAMVAALAQGAGVNDPQNQDGRSQNIARTDPQPNPKAAQAARPALRPPPRRRPQPASPKPEARRSPNPRP